MMVSEEATTVRELALKQEAAANHQWRDFFERMMAIPNGPTLSNDEFVTKLRDVLRRTQADE